MDNKKDQNPYGKYTTEDVIASESGHYYLQVGPEIFTLPNGMMAFEKDRIEYFFDQMFIKLNNLKKNGTAAQQADAKFFLSTLQIRPLRIH
jgi:hypothetical protein